MCVYWCAGVRSCVYAMCTNNDVLHIIMHLSLKEAYDFTAQSIMSHAFGLNICTTENVNTVANAIISLYVPQKEVSTMHKT
jgi:hypothetical protein